LHMHSQNWTICIPKQNEPGTISVGQCVCIKTNKSTDSLTKSLFQYVRSRGWCYLSPFRYTPRICFPRFKVWDRLPRVVSSYVLEFLNVSDLGAMCLVAKQYQLLRSQRLEQCGLGVISHATLNRHVRLHQLCMDQLYIYHLSVRVKRAFAAFV
jgi:hypothetical protein